MKKAIKTSLFGLLVVTGAILIAGFTGLIQGGNLGGYLFLGFLAVIIACQVVPALMLFGLLIKEIFHPTAKTEEEIRMPGGDGH